MFAQWWCICASTRALSSRYSWPHLYCMFQVKRSAWPSDASVHWCPTFYDWKFKIWHIQHGDLKLFGSHKTKIDNAPPPKGRNACLCVRWSYQNPETASLKEVMVKIWNNSLCPFLRKRCSWETLKSSFWQADRTETVELQWVYN